MNNSQVINTVLIVIGGGLLIYAIGSENAHVYFKIGGLILMMIGLYRATNFWVETKDDHKEDEDENNDNEAEKRG